MTELVGTACVDDFRRSALLRGAAQAFDLVIRHRDWAPTRKIDTRQSIGWWRAVIGIARTAGRTKRRPAVYARVRVAINDFIRDHRSGRL